MIINNYLFFTGNFTLTSNLNLLIKISNVFGDQYVDKKNINLRVTSIYTFVYEEDKDLMSIYYIKYRPSEIEYRQI